MVGYTGKVNSLSAPACLVFVKHRKVLLQYYIVSQSSLPGQIKINSSVSPLSRPLIVCCCHLHGSEQVIQPRIVLTFITPTVTVRMVGSIFLCNQSLASYQPVSSQLLGQNIRRGMDCFKMNHETSSSGDNQFAVIL